MGVVVRPELVPATDGSNLLYFWAGYEGPGLAPVFVLDLLTQAVDDPSKPLHIPPEFEGIGKRKIVIRTDAQNLAFDVHRFRWDSKSAPLMAGVQEPISRTPIEIGKLADLKFGLLVLQVFSPETQAVTRAFQLTAKRKLIELPVGHVTVIQDSDTPWYGVR